MKALKQRATGRKLLMINSTSDSPRSVVSFVKAIEIHGASPKDIIAVHIYDATRSAQPDPRILKGPGRHDITIPRGVIQLKRKRGSNPITVYALS